MNDLPPLIHDFPDEDARAALRPLERRLKAELETAYQVTSTPADRGSMISAAVRAYKRDATIEIMKWIGARHGLDLTVRIARKMIKVLLGRGISNAAVSRHLAASGRGPGDHSAEYTDLDRVEYIAEEYKHSVRDLLSDVTHHAKRHARAQAGK